MGPAPLVLLAAALAGVATLAAEVLWIRGVGRGIGTTYEALAMVAGLVLAGLGLGAGLGARFAPRTARPARGGAWLLAAAGTWIALSPLYLAALPDLRASGFSAESRLLPAFLLGVPLVLLPALALGAVFPYLVRARVADIAHAGRRAGGVYAANTAGAVAGLLLLLPVLGGAGETIALRLTGATAILGALALLLADRPLPHGVGPPTAVTPGQALSSGGLGPALFASGAAALLAQLAWLRLLQPLAGAHVYGLVLLLAPILLAMALGAALSGALADRVRHPSRLVPLLLASTGALLLLSLLMAGGAPLRVLADTSGGASRVSALAWAYLLTVAPATVAFGALLPAAVRARALWCGSAAGPAGRLYAWNALGALAGSLLGGFLLLPNLGAERTLFIAATLVVATAVLVRWLDPSPRRAVIAAAHALPLFVLAWPGALQGWFASGPDTAELIAARKPTPRGLELTSRTDMALYARWFGGRPATRRTDVRGVGLPVFEGRTGRIVLIEESDGRIGLRRGALRESVFDADRPDTPARTEYALGLLPGLLHASPGRALVIGHGAGWTAEAVMDAGARDVTVAEIDPTVLQAARVVRGRARLPVEIAETARVVEADGRVLLRAAAGAAEGRRYDVIASQPSHPWHPASGHLFTVEAWRTAHAALNDDGIHAQWLNLFDMTPELLRSALASYRAAFERVWVFRFPGEIVLLGFRGAPRIDLQRWESFFARDDGRPQAARAAGFGDAGALFKHILLDTASLDRLLPADVDVLEDDVPRLEMALASRRLRSAPAEPVEEVLLRGFPPDVEALLPNDTARERWITQAVHAWLDDGAIAEADVWARALRFGSTAAGRKAQARAALAAGDAPRAEALLRAAHAAAPDDGAVVAQWLRAVAALGARGEPDARDRRLATAERLAAGMPDHGEVQAAYARLLRSLDRVGEARDAFERAIQASDPGPPPGAGVQYARLLLSEEHGEAEVQRAIELLLADPGTYTQVDALDMLLRLTTARGDEKRARELDQALGTLQRTRGLALFRSASALLSRHDALGALEAARACTTVWTTESEPYVLHGLAAFLARAAGRSDAPGAGLYEREGVDAFLAAIERSESPDATRSRCSRMLDWFGLSTTLLEPRPDEDAE